LKIGDKILIGRSGYYPPVVRAVVVNTRRRRGRVTADCSRSYDPTADLIIVRRCDEGLTWCRGHDRSSKEAQALIVALAL
jgi:hypothetical protein